VGDRPLIRFVVNGVVFGCRGYLDIQLEDATCVAWLGVWVNAT